jgi:hypothetical protein
MPLTSGLLDVLLSHPCPRCGHRQEKKGSWFKTIATTPARPAATACKWATMRKSVFSWRTCTGRSSSPIRSADRRSGVSTLDQGQSRGLDELVIPLTALFLLVVLTFSGCAQGTTGQAGAPYPSHPPENVPEHAGGVGGGGM